MRPSLTAPLALRLYSAADDVPRTLDELAERVGEQRVDALTEPTRVLLEEGLLQQVPAQGPERYRIAAPLHFADGDWEELPSAIRRRIVSSLTWQFSENMRVAALRGGFDRQTAHLTRTAMHLDQRGWEQCCAVLETAQDMLDRIAVQARERLQDGASCVAAQVHLALFEDPACEGAVHQRLSGGGRP